MERTKLPGSRKKFLLAAAAVISSLTIPELVAGKRKRTSPSTNDKVKMLTQDGTLVEVDKELLASPLKKINNEELQQWIKK